MRDTRHELRDTGVAGALAVCAMLLGGAAPASAQTAADRLSPAASQLVPAPSDLSAAWAEADLNSRGETAVPVAMQPGRRAGVTWLLVGASLILAGLVIDGDAGTAVSVGGAIGAYGVYLVVRQ